MRPSAFQFQVGDLVVSAVNYPQRNHSIPKDTEGVVCDIDGDMIGVDWGFEVDGGHGCNDRCTYGYGWYVEEKEIKLWRDRILMKIVSCM